MELLKMGILTICACVFVTCGIQSERNNVGDYGEKNESKLVENLVVEKLDTARSYKLRGNSVVLKIGPGDDFKNLILENVVKTEKVKISARVNEINELKILKQKGDWVKVKVLGPDLFFKKFIGWILSSELMEYNLEERLLLENLDKDYLISLFENMSDTSFINRQMQKIKFEEKYKGIYVSKVKLGTKHLHRIEKSEIKHFEYVVFHTVNRKFWLKLSDELSFIGEKKSTCESKTKIVTYITPEYTFETFEPETGKPDLYRNELFSFYVMKTQKE